MIYRVVVTLEAERDLDLLYRFIAQDSPVAARRFADGLRKRLKTLSSLPRRCSRAPEDGLDGLEIRHLLYGSYRILFGIDGETVVVLQVRHSARRSMRER